MKNLFITGGAGYLGRALLRKLKETDPDMSCTIFSRDHGKHSRCQKEFPQHRYIIGDVRDYNSIELAMVGHDTVVHAAAFKYVPQGETNVAECHEINVMGSLNVARAAVRTGVERVIGISTDKACQPINVYGMTKLMMERLFQEADLKSDTQFNLVRYGNVVSSTGSAIPLFRHQARELGEVSLTDPFMTRFWLSVEEAVDLIQLALNEKPGGTILIPRLPALSVKDIAKAAICIEFDTTVADIPKIPFKDIGIRFGEKLFEDLMCQVESSYMEMHSEKIMRVYPMTSKLLGIPCKRYNSGEPDRRLTLPEAIRLIKEAPE